MPLFARFNSLLFNPDLYGLIITEIRMAIQKNMENVARMNAGIAANLK
jgi:hypothetical protein